MAGAAVKTVSLIDEAEAPPASQALTQTTDVALMFERLAKDPAVDVEKLERLIAMQERILKHQAKSAFDAAFAEMQPNLPIIAERKRADKSTYAPLEDIVEVIRPIIARFGFSLNHTTEWPDKATVKVIGHLKHVGGHAERSEFLSGADGSGSKNSIQALASAVSYGKRYTTKDLLLIVTREEDDDGKSSEKYKAPEAPAGYDDWMLEMESAAVEGWPKLSSAFNKSSDVYRKYTAKHNNDAWERLKAKAERVRA